MERLPDDIVANIISRLPVKKLLQIKCVSKLWNTMISKRQFAKLQLQQNQSCSQVNNGTNFNKVLVLSVYMQPISLDFENWDDDNHQFGETKLDFPLGYEQSIEILGYCDGMFCIEYGFEIVIWNPSIRQYRILPKAIGLPCGVPYKTYGFGFDSVADDYKVFRVFRESDKLVLDVFSLKTNCWGRVEYSTSVFPMHQSRNFLHGSLHWFDVSGYPDTISFLAFGLASEKFVEIPMPDVSGVDILEMVVFDGCLCVCCKYNNVSSGFDIWIMKEYMVKDSWMKLVTVLGDTIPILAEYLRPLCYARDGDILFEIYREGVVKYNMNKRSCTAVFNTKYELDIEYNAQIGALAYAESLVSPNHDDGERPIVDGVLKKRRKA